MNTMPPFKTKVLIFSSVGIVVGAATLWSVYTAKPTRVDDSANELVEQSESAYKSTEGFAGSWDLGASQIGEAPQKEAASSAPDSALVSGVAVSSSTPAVSAFSEHQAQNRSPDLSKLQMLVRNEPRDLRWAPLAEENLKTEYYTALANTGSERTLNIICAATLCEVTGLIAVGSLPDQASQTLAMVQDQKLSEAVFKLGFRKDVVFSVWNDPATPRQMKFTSYFERSPD